MSVGRICLRDVDLVDAGESALEAARRMRERGVGTLLVLDKSRRPIGIVTDRDLALRVLAEGRDPGATPVGGIMTEGPRTVSEETPIESALGLMKAGGFRRLPVVDREGRLAGIVSLDDVLALLAEEMVLIGRLVEREAPHQTR
jgi:CBS domain-containing protein